MVIQYQMVSSENIHVSNIIQTEQVISRNIYIYIMHLTSIVEKKAMDLTQKQGTIMGGLGRRKGKETCCNLKDKRYNLQNLEKHQNNNNETRASIDNVHLLQFRSPGDEGHSGLRNSNQPG